MSRQALSPTFAALLGDLRAEAANAAQRNKPTMWAYYLEMIEALEPLEALGDLALRARLQGLSRQAITRCPSLPPTEAARLWAVGIYARRALQQAGYPVERVSLTWLHKRGAAARRAA